MKALRNTSHTSRSAAGSFPCWPPLTSAPKATSDTGEYDSQDSGSFPSPALHLPQKHTFSSNLFVQGQTNAGIRSFFASSRSSGDLNEEKQSNLPDRVMPAQEHGDKSSPLAHQDQSLLSKENDNLHTDETLATDKADTSLPEDIVSEVFQVMSDITGVPLGEVKVRDYNSRMLYCGACRD